MYGKIIVYQEYHLFQKQYIFIYRALMEVAQYGDTEIPANELKVTIEKLKQCEKENGKCKMEEDFEVTMQITCFYKTNFLCNRI